MPLAPKGSLHRYLGIPADKKIPNSSLMSIRHEPGAIGEKATRVLNFRGVATGPRSPVKEITKMANSRALVPAGKKPAKKSKKPAKRSRKAPHYSPPSKSGLKAIKKKRGHRTLTARQKKLLPVAARALSRFSQQHCPVCLGALSAEGVEALRLHFKIEHPEIKFSSVFAVKKPRKRKGKKAAKKVAAKAKKKSKAKAKKKAASRKPSKSKSKAKKKAAAKAKKKAASKKASKKAAKKRKAAKARKRQTIAAIRKKLGKKGIAALAQRKGVKNPFGFLRQLDPKSVRARAKYDEPGRFEVRDGKIKAKNLAGYNATRAFRKHGVKFVGVSGVPSKSGLALAGKSLSKAEVQAKRIQRKLEKKAKKAAASLKQVSRQLAAKSSHASSYMDRLRAQMAQQRIDELVSKFGK